MLGFFSGVVLAVWYRNQGPQRPVYEWMDENSAEDEERMGEEETGGTGEGENGGMGEEETERQS